MESQSSFRFFSKRFLIILSVLFISSFGSAWAVSECFLCSENVPVEPELQKSLMFKKSSFSPVNLRVPGFQNTSETGLENTENDQTEPIIESVSEPVEAVKEPVIEEVAEPISEEATEPVTESNSEEKTEPVTEPISEEKMKLVAEPIVEQYPQDDKEKSLLLSDSFKKELIQQINKGECLDGYLKLQANAKTLAEKQLLKRLAPFCLEKHSPVLEVFEKSFLKAERGALIEYHKQTHQGIKQKIKILLTYLIHVRKEHPSSKEVPDLLNTIQNSIRQGNLEQAVAYTEELPLSLRPFFSSLNLQIETYLELMQLLKETP